MATEMTTTEKLAAIRAKFPTTPTGGHGEPRTPDFSAECLWLLDLVDYLAKKICTDT